MTASPRFIVPDNMLIDAVERARRDVRKIKVCRVALISLFLKG